MPSPYFFAQISVGTFATVLTVVVLVGAALIVLFSRRREDVHATLTANVAAQKELLSTTKEKLGTAETDLKAEREKTATLEVENRGLKEELKAAGLEYNQLALLDVAEWLKADKLKRENEALLEENRDLLEENRQLRRSQKRGGEES